MQFLPVRTRGKWRRWLCCFTGQAGATESTKHPVQWSRMWRGDWQVPKHVHDFWRHPNLFMFHVLYFIFLSYTLMCLLTTTSNSSECTLVTWDVGSSMSHCNVSQHINKEKYKICCCVFYVETKRFRHSWMPQAVAQFWSVRLCQGRLCIVAVPAVIAGAAMAARK